MGEGKDIYYLSKLQKNLLLMWHFEIISCSVITIVMPRAKYIFKSSLMPLELCVLDMTRVTICQTHNGQN